MTALPRGATPGPPADDDQDATASAATAAAGGAEPAGSPAVPASPEKPEHGAAPARPDDVAEVATAEHGMEGDAAEPDRTARAGEVGDASGGGASQGSGDSDGGGVSHRGDPSGSGGLSEVGDASGGGDGSRGGGASDEGDVSREGDASADGEPSGGSGDSDGGGVSEVEAELAAQRELRARIEQRKAEKGGPIAAGGKLSGQAADLLAAVRAVESGKTSGTEFFDSPAPAPRRPAPEPAAPARPAVAAAPVRPARQAAPETVAAVRAVLGQGGAPESLAGQVATVLRETAADVLREDPWQLLSVPGVRPEQADGFARALLGAECGPGDERRTVALIGWLLQRAALQGHTALDAAAVRAALAERSVPEPDEAVQHAIAEGAVLVFHDGPAGDGEADQADDAEPVPVLLGLDRYALAEESLADTLARLARTGPDARWQDAPPTDLTRAVAAHGLVAHTGGEAARAEAVALAEAARALGLRAVVATYTENGRRRLGTDVDAVTVAGLLAGAGGPGRDGEGALALDLLVVLDAPQLDVETAAMLVESLPDGCRLVLSGDPGVLWSAGAGRVFADVLAARACPQIASRTPDPGPIGELVSGIGIGELNQVEAPGKEVVIVPVRDAGEAVHRTVQLVADSVPRAIGVPAEQTQVITVGHGGAAGTRALNAALKQRLNPGPGRFGGFDPGDRVAHAPSPGRTVPGTVLSADAEGLHLDCEGERVVVPKDRVETALRHGWALTAHQAVGMRWPAAVVVLPGDAAQALDRAWVYTAFSRGERHLSVVHGADQALPRAVAEVLPHPRTTRLRALLESLLAPQED